jgi:hypothetical protein
MLIQVDSRHAYFDSESLFGWLFFTAMGAEALSRLTPEKSELLPAFIQKWEQTVYKSVYGKASNYINHLLSML